MSAKKKAGAQRKTRGLASPDAENLDALNFIPRQQLTMILRWWWLLAFGILVGAGLGWTAHKLQPPIYEARAVISTNINFSRTGALTDIEEDNAMGVVGDLIDSRDVMARTVLAANGAGNSIQLDEFRQAASIDRTDADWYLRVRSRDPQSAAQLANLWSQAAYSALKVALGHALIADGLQRHQDGLVTCLERLTEISPVMAGCNRQLTDIQQELKDTSAQVFEETLASKGILPAMAFQISQPADIPLSPAASNRGLMILSGGLAGLVLSTWMVLAGLPDLIRRKNHGR
jgi:hypothetical protein